MIVSRIQSFNQTHYDFKSECSILEIYSNQVQTQTVTSQYTPIGKLHSCGTSHNVSHPSKQTCFNSESFMV